MSYTVCWWREGRVGSDENTTDHREGRAKDTSNTMKNMKACVVLLCEPVSFDITCLPLQQAQLLSASTK